MVVGVTARETETAEAGAEHGQDVRREVTKDDEGKPVVDAQGDTVSMIEEARGGKAYIDPEPGLVDRIKTKLGWGNADEGDYTLDREKIERVTDDEVELSLK